MDNKKTSLKDIIEALSKEYRGSLQVKNNLEKQINEMELKMKDSNISHKDFLDLSENIKTKQQEILALNNYNSGVHNAREIVMSFL